MTASTYLNADRLFGGITRPADDPAGRLAFAAQWLLGPGMMLLAGIMGAARRGFHSDAIDGTRFPQAHTLEINLRYNTNTTEQLLLLAIILPALAVTLPHHRLVLVPAIAALFVFGRITFWIGYHYRPMARTFGMALTAIPILLSFSWLLVTALR
ncbi:MAG: hypothetical protein HOO94_02645 [Novosphingobium sp.]|nr:hypothetical protein [Novosphingobium sp.]